MSIGKPSRSVGSVFLISSNIWSFTDTSGQLWVASDSKSSIMRGAEYKEKYGTDFSFLTSSNDSVFLFISVYSIFSGSFLDFSG